MSKNKEPFKIAILILLVFIFCIICINIKFNTQDLKNNPPIQQLIDIPYFSYGSNMNIGQMNNRCKDGFKKISNGTLENYDFGFDLSGYANIKESKGKKVIGVLYHISKACLSSLDGYEGYPNKYNRILVDIKTDDNLIYNSFAYIQPENQFNGIASQPYLNIILSGAIDNNLLTSWIEHLKTFKK